MAVVIDATQHHRILRAAGKQTIVILIKKSGNITGIFHHSVSNRDQNAESDHCVLIAERLHFAFPVTTS